MKTLFDSLVRTLTPIIAGAVIGWFVTIGVDLDPEFAPSLIIVITGAFQGLYYLVVRLFEKYVSPKFGWLLGLAKPPVYDAKSKDEILARLQYLTPREINATINAAASRVGE